MKISEMTTDQAADVLIRITVPVSNIIHDEKSNEMLLNLATSDSKKPMQWLARNLTTVSTGLLKTHRHDMYEIVSALTGKPVNEIGKQRMLTTLQDIREAVDEELISFFDSSR